MQDTKVIKLLQSLNGEEFRRLGKFLRSPYYSYTTTTVKLYDHLKKYHPTFDSKKLEKEKVWKKLYPGKFFNDNIYWSLCFNFGKLIEKFLVAVQLEANPEEEKKLLIKALGQRNIYDLFEKETKGYLKKMESQPYRDVSFFEDKVHLGTDYFFHPMTPKLTSRNSGLTELMDSIDNHFVLMKLKLGSEMKNREHTLSKKYQMRWMDLVVQESIKGDLLDNPLAAIYRSVNALYEGNEKHSAYFQIKGLFQNSIHKLRKHDQSLISVQLINYAVRQINSGNESFYKEAFEINKIRLEEGLLIENERISEAGFGNVVILGCHAKEFDWVEKFMDENKRYLPSEIRENVIPLNIGLWYFYQNKFVEAYHCFSTFSYSHFYQPRARVNLIRTLFEQFLLDNSLFYLLMAQLENFEKFIYRSDVLTMETKKADINFSSILKQFAKGVFERKGKSLLKEKLLVELNKKKRIVTKEWLRKKIENLK